MASSASLSPHDAEAVLSAIQQVWPPNSDFRALSSRLLRQTVGADVCTLNCVDLGTGEREMFTDPPVWAERMAELSRDLDDIVQQHPLVELFMQSPSLGAIRLSDLPAKLRWKESDLYLRYYEPLGLRWQMVLPVPSADRKMHVYSLNRANEDFSDREVALCEAFLPMLALGLGGAPAPGDLRLDVSGGWRLVTLAADGTVASVTPAGTEGELLPRMSLPVEVHDAVQHDDIRSTVRTVIAGQGWQFRLLGRTRLGPVLVAGVLDSSAELPDLTARQRDVLQLIAAGHTNERIAHELGIAVGTVRKHVENLLVTLGAPNRAAAAALWQRANQ